MNDLNQAEAEMLTSLICCEPPITRECAQRLIAGALSVAEARGQIIGIDKLVRMGAAEEPVVV